MKKEQRRNLGEKIAQGILLIVLITLTIFMMSDVKKIQGNARVINYAGIIRGATQREIKLEISGNENDPAIMINDNIHLSNGLLFNTSNIIYNYQATNFYSVAQ